MSRRDQPKHSSGGALDRARLGGMTETTAQTRAPMVWPTFQARDARAMINFLTGIGFVETAVYADGDDVQHAQLDWPEGGAVMFGSHHPETDWSRDPGTAGFYVVTDHVDAVAARVEPAGGRIVRQPENADYGNYEFSCADPEGNLWSFGTYRGESPPA